ncbi:hypothetical protein MMC28_006849 [Mycoblastus sanguinarius]|nr:hypothetical protein [Mycoblastus sanguinarius]
MDKPEIIPSTGDRNLGTVLIGVNWAVFGPSIIIVCLRLVTRIWITRNFGWDDAMIALAQAVNAVGMGFVMLEVWFGLGRHVQYLPADHYVGFLKYNFLDWVQVFITLALSKISICLFLLRISKFERWRYFLFGLIAFLVLTHLPLTLLFLLQCIPLNKNWSTSVPGHCFSKRAVEKIIVVQGVFSIVTDFVGATFPVLLLWNSRLPMRQKIALNLLMGLGVMFVLSTSIVDVRTSYSWEILSNDVTWVGVGNALTRILEVNFCIIAACIPIMRPLILHLRNRFFPRKMRDSLDSIQTPASQLQWYSPPSATPWYKRLYRPSPDTSALPHEAFVHSAIPWYKRLHFSRFDAAALPHQDQGVEEKQISTPQTRKPRWPRDDGRDRDRDRPENATWAKDKEPEWSDSFELPLQGTRGSEYVQEEQPDFGTYRFHRGWV